MIRKITLVLISFIPILAFSQDYNFQTGSFIYDCASGGTLFASGGAGGYSANEDIVMTICPDAPGLGMALEIQANTIAQNDLICVYDGDDLTAPQIQLEGDPNFPTATAGCLDGNTIVELGGIIQTTVDNPTGCITIQFTSDATTNGNFQFGMDCLPRCQTFGSNVTFSDPDTTFDELYQDFYINVCPGDTIDFESVGNYPQNGLEYPQSDATSTFVWEWGDAEPKDTAQNISHFYDNPGGYIARLSMFDVNGCRNFQDQVLLIRVAPEPEFNTVWDSIICLGDSANLSGLPQGIFDGGAVQGGTEYFVPPFFSGDSIALPDSGNDAIYETSVVVNGFSNLDVIENCGQILDICFNMEHSWTGDLGIWLQCPNGTQVDLIENPNGGGGTFMGDALDDGSSNPGIGFEYCFTTDAAIELIGAPTVTTTLEGGQAWEEGEYLPVGDFEDFIGCPINGTWTLFIQDNLAIDNGTLFNWALNIDPCMYPDIDSFTMTYNLGVWDSDPTIVEEVSQNEIIVLPDAIDTFTYIYTVTDNFGCEYSTDYDVVIRDLLVESYGDTAVCLGDTATIGWQVLGGESKLCGLTLELQDSWGDGWNGSNITVDVDGVSTNYTFTGTQGNPQGGQLVIPIEGDEDANVTITYNRNGGGFPTEQFFQVLDGAGTQLFSAGSVPCFECTSDDGQNAIPDGTSFNTTLGCVPVFDAITDASMVDTACSLGLTIFDAWGDGWSGAEVEVLINGGSQGTFSVADQGLILTTISENFDFAANFGDVVTFNYSINGGSAPGENSFDVTNADGDALFSSGSNPADGTTFEVTLNEDVCVIDPFVIFSWTPTNTLDFTTDDLNPTAEVYPDNFTTYQLTSNFSNGCDITSEVQVDLITFDFTLTDDTSICDGDDIQLNSSGSDSYAWTINNETLNDTAIANPIGSPLDDVTYYVILDSAGCKTLDSVVVVVNDIPTATINNGLNPVEFCEGGSTTLFAQDSVGWTFEWQGPESGDGAEFDVSSEGPYVLTFTDENGCFSTESVDVVQNDSTLFDLTAVRNILCCTDDGVEFNLSDFVTNGATIESTFFDGSLNNGVVTVDANGENEILTFPIRYVTIDGCESNGTVSFEVKCIEPTIGAIDTAFSFAPEQFSVTTAGTDTYTFDWSVDNIAAGDYTTGTGQTTEFTAAENEGVYNALVDATGTYTLNDGSTVECVESDEEEFQVVLITDPLFPDAFTPNGDGQNDFFLPILAPLSEITDLRVYNRWHQVVYNYTANSVGWDGTFKGDLQPQETYYYYVRILNNDGEEIIKDGSLTLIR